VYEQLTLEDNDLLDTPGPAAATERRHDNDDIGAKFDDHIGLASRVRQRCYQHWQIVQLAMHRETIYQGYHCIAQSHCRT